MAKRKVVHFELVLLTVLALVPWPGTVPPRPPCPRDRAALVRKVLEKRWLPVLERVGAPLPLECPLHPLRDLFWDQEAHKRRQDPHWVCAYCGQVFYHETHLDWHLETWHGDKLNEHEDSICLADYCDVMRCDVLQQKTATLLDDEDGIGTPEGHTAIDVWTQHALVRSYHYHDHKHRHHHHGTDEEAVVQPRAQRSVMKPPLWQLWRRTPSARVPDNPLPPPPPPSSPNPPNPTRKSPTSPPKTGGKASQSGENVPKSSNSGDSGGDRSSSSGSSPNTHSSSGANPSGTNARGSQVPTEGEERSSEEPKEIPMHPLHSWRDTCNEEHLAELRAKCQMLIHQCIAGLVLNLTLEQVRDVEGALQRSVCWYLTCERYWEASPVDQLSFPWLVVSGVVLLLTLGVSLAYYIVWGLCESQDATISPTTAPAGSYLHHHSSVPNPSSVGPYSPYLHQSSSDHLHHQPLSSSATLPHHSSSSVPLHYSSSTLPAHHLSSSAAGSSYMGQCSPTPGYTSYSVMSGSSRRRKLWAHGNDSESECRDSGFNDGPLGGDLSNDEVPSQALATYEPLPPSMGGSNTRSRHYSADSRPSSSIGGAAPADDSGRIEDRQFNYASSFTPNYELRRLRRNRYNYLDDFDSYSELDVDQLEPSSNSSSRDRSENFIYVAYPPEIKKRFQQEQQQQQQQQQR